MLILDALKKENIELAALEINKLNLVIFPTETVYGLGALATSDLAVSKIFEAKNRPTFNPLIVHYSSLEAIKKEFNLNEVEEKLAQKFWPGALTLILEKPLNSKLSLLCSNGSNLQAVRVPNHKTALSLIEKTGALAAPSANISNHLSPTAAQHAFKSFEGSGNNILILDGGSSILGLESTIINARDINNIQILRYGSLDINDIESIGIKIKPNDNKVVTPGSLLKHYSPKIPLRINANSINEDEALLAFGEVPTPLKKAKKILNLSEGGNLQEAASNLFKMLWELDTKEYKSIAVTKIPNAGLGIAINDRIKRASHNESHSDTNK